MKSPLLSALLCLSISAIAFAEDKTITIDNGSFSEQLGGWETQGSVKMSSAPAPEGTPSGAKVLFLEGFGKEGNAAITAKKSFPVQPGKRYLIKFRARSLGGSGGGAFIVFYDSKKKQLKEELKAIVTKQEWMLITESGIAPGGAAEAKVMVRTWFATAGSMEITDLGVLESDAADTAAASGNYVNQNASGVTSKIEGGSLYVHDGIYIQGAQVNEQELYRAHYFGEFKVTFLGLSNGKYKVVVGNVELSDPNPDYRVFNIYANGKLALKDINLNKQFGFGKKNEMDFEAEVSDGTLNLEFKKGESNWPRVSLVRVYDSKGSLVGEFSAASADKGVLKIERMAGFSGLPASPLREKPVWEPLYKIRANEKGRMTAADIIGPDGLVYPDWRYAGNKNIQIPKKEFPVRDFGAKPGEKEDCSTAVQAAIYAAEAAGGGVVKFESGEYYLDRPVVVRQSNVWIFGQGMDKTKIIARYGSLDDKISFFQPLPGDKLGTKSLVQVAAEPKGLKKLYIRANGQEVAKLREVTEGPEYAATVFGKKLFEKFGAGMVEFEAVAEWKDGSTKTIKQKIQIAPEANDEGYPTIGYTTLGAINFLGGGTYGKKILLTKDGERGSVKLQLEDGHGFKKGDRFVLEAPTTPRWSAILNNKCKWFKARMNMYEVVSVDGNTITINQPLRIIFPTIDQAYVQKISCIENSGIQNMTVDQPKDIWTHGVMFQDTWDCLAQNVRMNKAGRMTIYFFRSKFSEIRDCEINDAWWQGGGGTAYAGWEFCFDGLIDGMKTTDLRHAPLFQWAASGCVIRNSKFIRSDIQWHSGWANENLLETCEVIDPGGSEAGYKYVALGTAPEDDKHGAIGPRNVVYNNKIDCKQGGFWFGGMNEGWIIAYNDVTYGQYYFLAARYSSFDHIFLGNAITVKSDLENIVYLADKDCTGIEFIDNKIIGFKGKIVTGRGELAVDKGTEFLPEGTKPMVKPPVPSIYEWQLKNKPLGK